MDNHELVKNTYDQIADSYHKTWDQYTNFFLDNVDQFIKLLPENAEVLDLGCGSGRDSKYMSEKGLEVIGIDFSENMLKIARTFAPKAKFLQKDIRDLADLTKKFDGVWFSFSILHLKRNEVPEVIKSIKKILKPSGVLFIATKGGVGERIEVEHLDEKLQMFETYFELEELEKILIESNFDIISTKKITKREGAEVEEDNGYAIVIFSRNQDE